MDGRVSFYNGVCLIMFYSKFIKKNMAFIFKQVAILSNIKG